MSIEVAVVLGLAAISGVLAFLSVQVDREQHGVLQVLFLMMSLWFGYGTIGSITEIVRAETTYSVLDPLLINLGLVQMWGAIIVTFYLIIVVIYNLFQNIIEWKNKRKQERLGFGSDDVKV